MNKFIPQSINSLYLCNVIERETDYKNEIKRI
jgi:hypothetical protein